MSVTDHEIEPVDEWQGWCDVHEQYYLHLLGYRCTGCANDEADRLFDSWRKRKG